MADNVNITAGAGTIIATDQVGTDHYQKVKLTDGTADSSTMIVAGGGVEAAALRVTIASDSTGVLSVDDNGSTITVDGTIAVSAITDALPAGTNAIGKLASNTGVDIGDVDVTSIIPGIGATNLGKAEDAAHSSGDVGVMALAVRQDSQEDFGADGDYVPLSIDANGALRVSGGGGGTEYTEDDAAPANPVGTAILAERDDALGGLTPVAGDWSHLFCDANGALWVHDDALDVALSGTELQVDIVAAIPAGDNNIGNVDIASSVAIAITDNDSTLSIDDGDSSITVDQAYHDNLQCNANMQIGDADVGAGNPVPVSDNGGAITVDGTVAVTNADITSCKTALESLDNSVDGNYLNVNLNVAGTDVAANAGVLNAQTVRVTIATDDEVNNLLGTIDVDTSSMATDLGTVATDTTSIDGKITACNTGAVVLSSGTVTTVSTVTNLSQLGGAAINMGEGTIDTGTQRVTLATDDDGVAHLATIAGDTTSIQTAVEIMDDWDATHDSAASADGPQLMAAYDATKPAAVADGDAVRVLSDSYGRLLAGVEPTKWQAAYDSADATAEGKVVKASAASTIIVVQSYIISSDVEGWIKLQDEDSTALTGKFWLKAGGGVAITLPDNAPIVLGVDKDLEVICEAAGDISVSATGYTIPG